MSDTDANQPESDVEDPRLDQPVGDRGMPGELIDTPSNMPGDQPIEDDPPTVSELHGRDDDD